MPRLVAGLLGVVLLLGASGCGSSGPAALRPPDGATAAPSLLPTRAMRTERAPPAASLIPAHPAPSRAPAPTALLPPAKGQRTAAQRKIDSNLLAMIHPGAPGESQPPVVVDISARLSDALLARMRALGAEILATDASSHSIRARLPLTAVEPLADDDDVRFIQPAQNGVTQ